MQSAVPQKVDEYSESQSSMSVSCAASAKMLHTDGTFQPQPWLPSDSWTGPQPARPRTKAGRPSPATYGVRLTVTPAGQARALALPPCTSYALHFTTRTCGNPKSTLRPWRQSATELRWRASVGSTCNLFRLIFATFHATARSTC